MAGVFYNSIPAQSTNNPAYGVSAKAYSLKYLKGLYARPGAWKHMTNVTTDAGFGETVSLGEFQAVTPVDVTVSTGAFNYDNTSVLMRTVTMDQIKAVPHSVPEHTMIQAKIDVKAALAENAGMALNDSVDAEMAELIASISTNSAGSANADLSETYVFAALQKLVENNVSLANPMDLAWILPGTQFGAVHLLKGYTSYRTYAGATDTEGSNDVKADVLTLCGIDVYFRNDSALSVSSGKIGGLFHKDSVGVAIQKAPTFRIGPIAGTINTEMLAYSIFGVGLICEKRSVKVLCK